MCPYPQFQKRTHCVLFASTHIVYMLPPALDVLCLYPHFSMIYFDVSIPELPNADPHCAHTCIYMPAPALDLLCPYPHFSISHDLTVCPYPHFESGPALNICPYPHCVIFAPTCILYICLHPHSICYVHTRIFLMSHDLFDVSV